jgi:D-alanyl-D-alanine endopeptidase (penicillin-binding protein 7)
MKALVRGAIVALNVGLALAVFSTSSGTASRVAPSVGVASLTAGLSWFGSWAEAHVERTDAAALVRPPPPWTPPPWHPGDLSVLRDLDRDPLPAARAPKVRSPSAIVVDLDRGEVLWARDPDSPRTIASVTKLFSALALASTSPDLDSRHCVTFEQWPSRPGARSKFETGHCYAGWDFLGAALVSSDNRGAFALPAVAGEDYYAFVDRMNDVAIDIGADSASFVDPAGLEDENVATVRDVLKAAIAVSAHPDLSIAASANGWTVEDERRTRQLLTTNRLDGRYDTLAAKTGYTDTARYCFATVVRTDRGRTLAAAVLGAPNNSTRFSDVRALVDWADGL